MCGSADVVRDCDASSPAALRAWTTAILGTAYAGSDPVVEDATLVVSELVANAVEAGAVRVAVDLDLHDDVVRVGVADAAGGLPVLRSVDLCSVDGRGLAIVQALSRAWGTDAYQVAPGKTVWAVLEARGSTAFACGHPRGEPGLD